MARKIKHGMRFTPIYKHWINMKCRCYNKNRVGYKNYGGRGITVCDEWRNNFERFYNDMNDTYIEGLSLERVDNNKGYSKENCKRISRSEQSKNRRNSIFIEYEGISLCVEDRGRRLGIPGGTIRSRYYMGYSIEDCLSLGKWEKQKNILEVAQMQLKQAKGLKAKLEAKRSLNQWTKMCK